MTIIPRLPVSHRSVPGFVLRKRHANALAKRMLPNDWLRPAPGNLGAMRRVLRKCLSEGRDYAMFMTHSTELMPGGSPCFPNSEHIEQLYEMLDVLFAEVATNFRGVTLSDYAREILGHVAAAEPARGPGSAN